MTKENGASDPRDAASAPQARAGRRRLIAGGVAIAVVVVLLGTLGDREDGTPATASPTTTGTGATLATSTTTVAGPNVPKVDACDLLTDEEVERVLGVLDISSRGMIIVQRGEGCVWQPVLDGQETDDLTVAIAPGSPDDFAAGASLDGTPGVPVEGAGEAAVWFGDTGAGTISVVQGSSVGYVFVRVAVARSDLDDAARLEAATDLVAAALPRYPGTVPGESTAPAPEVDLCDLVTDAEAEEVLAPYRGTHPATLDEVLVTRDFSGAVDLSAPSDVSCTKLILAEIYVSVEPGSDDDFSPGATMEGAAGETVSGVGEEAAWFAGVPVQGSFSAPHENGVLAVRSGEARFRIRLALPDTPVDDQLELATRLAATALTRIPGVEAGGIAVASPDLVDDSGFGFVENLASKIEAGEWTLGDGLLASLRVIAGEPETAGVLRDPQLVDRSGASLVQLAELYVASEGDGAAEIAALLDEMYPSTAELDSVTRSGAADEEPDAAVFAASHIAQQQDDELCMKLFGVEAPCLRKETSPELEAKWPGKYALYRPLAKVANGWTLDKVDPAVDALTASASQYEELVEGRGGMPPVAIFLTGTADAVPWTDVGLREGTCVVRIHPPAQQLDLPKFQQTVARDIAYCLESRVFADVTGIVTVGEQGFGSQWWWSEGLAIYLSDVVYPDANIEHDNLPFWLANEELTTPLLSRSGRTWIFFEHLHSTSGTEQILDLVTGLPATLENVRDEWHPFNQALTDVAVPDVSGKLAIPYQPPKNDVEISGTGQATFEAQPLGVNRLDVQVTGGRSACVSFTSENDVETSWRAGPPGASGGSWSGELPDRIDGEVTILLTATGSGQTGQLADGRLTIEVSDVVEIGDECEPDEPPPPPPSEPGCPELICGPSSYFKDPEQLPPFLRRLLGL